MANEMEILRLLRLIAIAVLVGSGNMTEAEIEEMKTLSGYSLDNKRVRTLRKERS